MLQANPNPLQRLEPAAPAQLARNMCLALTDLMLKTNPGAAGLPSPLWNPPGLLLAGDRHLLCKARSVSSLLIDRRYRAIESPFFFVRIARSSTMAGASVCPVDLVVALADNLFPPTH